MRALALSLVMALSLLASKAEAGGFIGGRYCNAYYNAQYLLSLDLPTMREEVYQRYYAAVDVFNRRETIYSRSPRFEWANQTKIACGKAIGWLKRAHLIWGPEIDAEAIQKCECFYDRMVSY
jgi:hypothetical protein